MEYFDCNICLESIAIPFAQVPCVDERHKTCMICYQKMMNKKKCPVCRQKNPMWSEPIQDSESSDDEDMPMLIGHILNQHQQALILQFQQLALYHGIGITIAGQGHNAENQNEWH